MSSSASVSVPLPASLWDAPPAWLSVSITSASCWACPFGRASPLGEFTCLSDGVAATGSEWRSRLPVESRISLTDLRRDRHNRFMDIRWPGKVLRRRNDSLICDSDDIDDLLTCWIALLLLLDTRL